MDHLQHLPRVFREHAPTLHGQLVGLALMVLPALTHPLGLGGAHQPVQVVAVVLGWAGAVIVFGGLAERVFLQTATPDQLPDQLADQPVTLDESLLAVPHARQVWLAMIALSLALAAGAICYLVLLLTDGWQHLPGLLMLALPAAALGGAAWRARVMRAGVLD